MVFVLKSIAQLATNIEELECFRELSKDIKKRHKEVVKAEQDVAKINMILTRLNVRNAKDVTKFTGKVQKGNLQLRPLGEDIQCGLTCLRGKMAETEWGMRHREMDIQKLSDLLEVCLALQVKYQQEQDIPSAAVVLNLDGSECSAYINKLRKKVVVWEKDMWKNQNAINKLLETPPLTKWYQPWQGGAMSKRQDRKSALLGEFQRHVIVIQDELRRQRRNLTQYKYEQMVVLEAIHVYEDLFEQLSLLEHNLTYAVDPNIAKFMLQNIPS